MRIKLFATLIVFVLCALILMWGFQIFMLDAFYYQSTKSRMESAAYQIESAYETDRKHFSENVLAIGLNNDFCIYAFNCYGDPIAKVDSDTGCIIHAINGEALTALYERALQNGGEYYERADLAGFKGSERRTHALSHPMYHVRDRILHVSVKETKSGPLIIILDAAISPANVIKGALGTQLIIITIIMVLIAGLVSNALAKKLSRPIADVNRAAKQLTVGEYDVEFTGEGYREIYELSDTLNQTAKELKKTDLMRKELIANISHDLRTPLTLITGYCEMMRDIEGENTPENMQVVLDETARLSSLVNDLIDLSKYQNGSEKFETESVDMDFLLLETIDRYKKLMQGKDYTFVYESVGPTFVTCDKKRILQVIYNLINNAINYAGDDKTVILKLSVTEQGKVRVEVIDHGAGIAKEDLPLIFDRYYKVDKVHRRAVTGTGLGLSIVKGILEKHGAAYGVQSEVGQGSIFYFEL
ncbi:MAG: HAMP domain-containing protein [Clostridia bacterium]|nr:HAMP domain-containing protein [Clostridia bacterium]